MNRSILQMVVRRAEAMAAGPGADAPGDGLLLSRFVQDRDNAAFGTLLARHAPMVWGVCQGLLPCDADAEDAFQATFLALLRGAKSIRETKSIAPWLHGTATRIAKKSRLTNGRRNTRERKSARHEAATVAMGDGAWDQAHLAVHEEIAALPVTLRTAFVLCVLEGDRHHDAAAKLGVPIGTVSARVSRARQKLLDRLNARGIAPVAMVATLVAGPAAVPAALLDSVRMSVSDGFATAGSAVVHLATTALTETGGTTMKTKLLAAAVMIAGAIGTTGGSAWINKAGGQSAPPAVATPTAPRYPVAGEPVPGAYQPPTPSAAPTPWAVPPTPPSRAAWEHLTVARPKTAKGFQDMLKARSNEGWEYVGSESFGEGDETTILSVFKRPLRALYYTMPASTTPVSPNMSAPTLSPTLPVIPRYDAPSTVSPVPFAYPPTQPGPGGPRYEAPSASVPPPSGRSMAPPSTQPVPFASSTTPPAITASGESRLIPSANDPATPRTNQQSKIVKLKNLAAADVASVITQYLQVHQPDQKRMGIVAEPVSNSLLITAPDLNSMEELLRVIGELDASPKSEPKPSASPTTKPAPGTAPRPSVPAGSPPKAPPSDAVYEVIALNHSESSEVAKIINELYSNQQSDDSPVRIVAEKSSNQIVILTADANQVKEIRRLVKVMDAPKKFEAKPDVPRTSPVPVLPASGTGQPTRTAETTAASPNTTEVVHLRNIAAADAEKSLADYLNAQPLFDLKQVRVATDARTNSMTITGSNDQTVKAILRLVRAMDATPEATDRLTPAQRRFQNKEGDSAMISLKHANAVAVAKSIQVAWDKDKRAKDNTVDIAADATSNSIYVGSTNPKLLKEFRDKIQESDKLPMPESKPNTAPTPPLPNQPSRSNPIRLEIDEPATPSKTVTIDLTKAVPSRVKTAIVNITKQLDPPVSDFALVADDLEKQIALTGSRDVIAKIEQMIRELDGQVANPPVVGKAANHYFYSTFALPEGFGQNEVKQLLSELQKRTATPVEIEQMADGKSIRFGGTSEQVETIKAVLKDFSVKKNR
jgi:RNA polymerase sigma factor (sigma-70 family)